MSKVKIMIKELVGKLIVKRSECLPASNLKQIQEMYTTLPHHPAGRAAPVWTKTETDGPNGENTS